MFTDDKDGGFLHAFSAAIRAYRKGSIPIGCAILDERGCLLSTGENSIYTSEKSEIISGHSLAHAELNAILKLDPAKHPNIQSYTLFTTMESCPLCFGAIVMGRIRNVKFAALDKHNEFVKLNSSVEYIAKQNIKIDGPFEKLQTIQIALIIFRRLKLEIPQSDEIIQIYNSYCAAGVKLGLLLYDDLRFHEIIDSNSDEKDVIRYMLSLQ